MKTLFLLSGLIPILGLFSSTPGTALLIYTFFVIALFFSSALQRAVSKIPRFLALLLSAIVAGMLTETLAWIENYFQGFSHVGALFSTHLGANLLIGLGFYSGLAIALAVVVSIFRFSVKEMFVMYGLFGIFLEQTGAVVIQAFAFLFVNPLMSALIVLYAFLVHGSIAGLSYLPVSSRYAGEYNRWYKYPVALAILYVGVAVGTLASGLITTGVLGIAR